MDFRSGTELFHLERMFGSGGAGVFEREKSSHKIWTQANSFWFEDASSLESCAQLSKTKSLGIPIMSNIYILKDFFFPMKFDPDYKNSLLYWMCQNAVIALPKCLCSQTMRTISVSAKSSTKGSARYWSFCCNKHTQSSVCELTGLYCEYFIAICLYTALIPLESFCGYGQEQIWPLCPLLPLTQSLLYSLG